MNGLPLAHELLAHVRNPDAQPHSINMTQLPISEADRLFLSRLCGPGNIQIRTIGYGESYINATGLRHVWHLRCTDTLKGPLLESYEICPIPEVVLAAPEDLVDSAIMETIYVVTGKTIYRDMTRFWGKLFGINFALGVATGLTMEFQFGTNWSFYSNYVGDIFGAPLAMEALMAFFLESTFVGLFFFGWQRLNKYQHLLVTWLVAFGSNLSALWILNANGWMQYPTGAHFDIDTLRMEMTSFSELVFNPVSQVKFVHTVMAGYVTGAMFIMAISAWYLLRGRERDVALRSFAIGSVFGTLAIIGTLQLGDSSAYEVAQVQPVKLAAMEGEWQTEPAPAPFHVAGTGSRA